MWVSEAARAGLRKREGRWASLGETTGKAGGWRPLELGSLTGSEGLMGLDGLGARIEQRRIISIWWRLKGTGQA